MTEDRYRPGSEFRTRGRTITESDLVAFSALTGDWHPQHSDELWARSSAFGGRIAHGMLVLSYAFGLIGFDPERIVALRGIRNATFKQPVRLGETISVRGRVVGAKPAGDGTSLLHVRLRIVCDDDGRLVAVADVSALAREEPEAVGP
jgi:acyl dehydratase